MNTYQDIKCTDIFLFAVKRLIFYSMTKFIPYYCSSSFSFFENSAKYKFDNHLYFTFHKWKKIRELRKESATEEIIFHEKTDQSRSALQVDQNRSPTGTCFIQKIYALSSSLLQGKHLPFTPSPLRLNIFPLFVILSLTQLYRYTPEIFLFSTATFKYTYRAPSDKLDKNIQRTSQFSTFHSLKRIQSLPVRSKLI